MAKIKYIEDATPLLNEHDGYTFQPNNYGQSMFPSSRSARKRYGHQLHRQHNNQKAVTQWRNMSQTIKDNWNAFAAAVPQPSKRDPNKFLTGYQCFIRRNSYCFLNHGILSDFMEEPELTILPEGTVLFELRAGNAVIDATDLYIQNFGILPQVGQHVILYAHMYSEYSGQFFTPVSQVCEVLEVYADGFFINVDIPDELENVTISVYLSKVFNQSVQYAGTKCRYMGCFTKKTFISLCDTLESYLGAAGKIVMVNTEEDGLIFAPAPETNNAFNPIQVDGEADVTADQAAEPVEFVAGENITIETSNDPKQVIFSASGGGSFNCDDLLNCDIFTELQQMIWEIANILTIEYFISIPAVKCGLLYNWYACNDPRGICAEGWQIPIYNPDIFSWYPVYGSNRIIGGKLKETGLNFWNAPNTGATNELKFNLRGSGRRLPGTDFSDKDTDFWMFMRNQASGSGGGGITAEHNSTVFISKTLVKIGGGSLRPCRTAIDLSEGESGVYVGNNGRRYRTIVINNLEICADNLAETLWRNGEPIEEVTDLSEWVSRTDGIMCAYNNDWSNV
jgi:hypothetical protein